MLFIIIRLSKKGSTEGARASAAAVTHVNKLRHELFRLEKGSQIQPITITPVINQMNETNGSKII